VETENEPLISPEPSEPALPEEVIVPSDLVDLSNEVEPEKEEDLPAQIKEKPEREIPEIPSASSMKDRMTPKSTPLSTRVIKAKNEPHTRY
jgi:hypothetical protein